MFVEDEQVHEHPRETDKASQTVLVVRDHLRSYTHLPSLLFLSSFSVFSKFPPFFSLPNTGKKETPVRLPRSSQQRWEDTSTGEPHPVFSSNYSIQQTVITPANKWGSSSLPKHEQIRPMAHVPCRWLRRPAQLCLSEDVFWDVK